KPDLVLKHLLHEAQVPSEIPNSSSPGRDQGEDQGEDQGQGLGHRKVRDKDMDRDREKNMDKVRGKDKDRDREKNTDKVRGKDRDRDREKDMDKVRGEDKPLPTLPDSNPAQIPAQSPLSQWQPFPGSCPSVPCPQSLSSSPGAPPGSGMCCEVSLDFSLLQGNFPSSPSLAPRQRGRIPPFPAVESAGARRVSHPPTFQVLLPGLLPIHELTSTHP
uniref:Uncharacterized protein n=1 Tax=Serinus canaria TaxID=9135 RepID=A0A8C9NU11_SERCA